MKSRNSFRCHLSLTARKILPSVLILSLSLSLTLCAVGLLFNNAASSAAGLPASPNRGFPHLRGAEALAHLKEQGVYSSLQEAIAAARADERATERASESLSSAETKLTTGEGTVGDHFGQSVAVSGSVVVIGAPVAAFRNRPGKAYVFHRSGSLWIQQSLIPGDGHEHDFFGRSVAISGNSIVVGAPGHNVGSNTDQGAVYVFVRNGNVWTQQQKLTASDGETNDSFGYSVAIDGETIIAGLGERQQTSFFGAAYIYVRNNSTWTQHQKLTHPDGSQFTNEFGTSVDISGGTVVVSALGEDIGTSRNGTAFVFVRRGNDWIQQQKLITSDGRFGLTSILNLPNELLKISGDTIVFGLPGTFAGSVVKGAAYVFVRNGSVWTEQRKLTASDGAEHDDFGHSVAINGDKIIVGAPFSTSGGSAYQFTRSGTAWTQQKITASDGGDDTDGSSENFGYSVATAGQITVVGAYGDDIGSTEDQGSAYVFDCGRRTDQAQISASDGATGDFFGNSVAISGETVVVGSFLDDETSGSNQGSAYVFVRGGVGGWTQQQKIKASDGLAQDLFGFAVGISGDTIVVGVPFDTVGSVEDQGSAYIFVRNGTAWTQQQKLTAGDGALQDQFGHSVAASGNTIVIGTRFDDIGSNFNQGSAYVFGRSGTTWTQQQKLTAGDGGGQEIFGFSVGIDGDTIAVGASEDDIGTVVEQGSVYIFVRSGTTWTEQQKLTADDASNGDRLGNAVGVSGDTVVAGAAAHDVTAGNLNQGAAYVFTRAGTSWSQQQKLVAINSLPHELFGTSVAISGDTIVAGAPSKRVGTNNGQGAAHVYVRSGTGWQEQELLTATNGASFDNFGTSVSVSGETIVAGADLRNVGSNPDQGAAYVFFGNCPSAPNVVSGGPFIRQRCTQPSPTTLASISDNQEPPGNLSVAAISVPAGITLTSLVNFNGTVSANLGAACDAALGVNNIVLRVSDLGSGITEAAISVSVTEAPGGSLQFGSSAYSAGESASTATINVTRINGSVGAASVSYATANGTANGGAACGNAGVDYVTSSGTLNWADGDAAVKTFTVTVCNDSVFEGDETLNLGLSNVMGAAALSSPSTAVLTIVDDDTQPTPTPTPTPTPIPTPTPTPSPTPVSVTTSPGTDVNVQGNGVSVTFSEVTIGGTTTIAPIDPNSTGSVPSGYAILGSSVAFEITTTAGISPPIDLCFNLSTVNDPTAFANLRVLHNENGLLVDRTLSHDFPTRTVCARTTTLSPFLVAAATQNPIDGTDLFVTQHYRDFLSREPDAGGLQFWSNGIDVCGTDLPCREVKRINASAAFFLSIEFQETGYLVYRFFKTAYGDSVSPRVSGTVPIIRRHEFLPDTARISQEVRVGIGDWQQQLEANKQAYALEFVQRQRFLDAFPLSLTPAQFVDQLNQRAGGVLSSLELDVLIAELTVNNTSAGRASAVRSVAENSNLRQAELNRAFVLMQYYGYLRRNPDEGPDTNFGGWKFWLDKLNQFNGNFIQAEMVKAFTFSIEYRERFFVQP